jgi:hypothetical protein
MNPVLIGQLLGVSFAAGLNLYATVAAVGILSRLALIPDLPPALKGLESPVVIGTALLLFLVEAIIDRVRHADSIWDTVHTFIRPPAAALLAAGALWGQPLNLQLGAATLAFSVALAAHSAKAGLRVALNAANRNGIAAYVSSIEDLAAIGLVTAALVYPSTAIAAGAVVTAILLLFGPRLWRAFALGLRCVTAWFRSLFVSPGWREPRQLPRRLRELIEEQPLGMAPPRATRAAVNGLPGAGAYRNGWLVLTHNGARFLYGGWVSARSIQIPEPERTEVVPGVWLHSLRLHPARGNPFTLYILKEGPPVQVILEELQTEPV